MTELNDSERRVRDKAERMVKARRSDRSFWKHLAHVGVLGWVFILPVLLSIAVGRLLAWRMQSKWPTVAGILFGIAIGGWATYRQLRQSLDESSEP